MPHTPQTNHGTSLRTRASTAAALTAQRQQQRRARASRPEPEGPRAKKQSKRAERPSEKHAPQTKAKTKTKPKTKPKTKRQATSRKIDRSKGTSSTGTGKPSLRSKFATASRGRVIACLIVALAVVAVALLYPAGQFYYQTLREKQRSEAQLAAINSRNEAISQKNDELETDEGIEDAAREQGYVEEGEKSVYTNVKEDSSSQLPEQVDIDSIHAPSTWYYNILDVIFFVEQ